MGVNVCGMGEAYLHVLAAVVLDRIRLALLESVLQRRKKRVARIGVGGTGADKGLERGEIMI